MTAFLPIEAKYHISQNKIYKYVSLYTAEIIIATLTLRFSNSKDFNDPFDCDENILEFNMKEKGSDIEIEINNLLKEYIK